MHASLALLRLSASLPGGTSYNPLVAFSTYNSPFEDMKEQSSGPIVFITYSVIQSHRLNGYAFGRLTILRKLQ